MLEKSSHSFFIWGDPKPYPQPSLSLIFSSCSSFQEHKILTYCISRCKILSATWHTLSHFLMQIPSTTWHTLSHFLMPNPFCHSTHSTTLADANFFHHPVTLPHFIRINHSSYQALTFTST